MGGKIKALNSLIPGILLGILMLFAAVAVWEALPVLSFPPSLFPAVWVHPKSPQAATGGRGSLNLVLCSKKIISYSTHCRPYSCTLPVP